MGIWANVFCLLSLLWTGHCLGKSHHLLTEPIFTFLASVGLLAIAPAMSFHHVYYGFVLFLPSHFCYGLAISPPFCKFFVQGFSDPLFTSLPLLGFVGQYSCYTSPFHYIILQASPIHLLPLLLSWTFY